MSAKHARKDLIYQVVWKFIKDFILQIWLFDVKHVTKCSKKVKISKFIKEFIWMRNHLVVRIVMRSSGNFPICKNTREIFITRILPKLHFLITFFLISVETWITHTRKVCSLCFTSSIDQALQNNISWDTLSISLDELTPTLAKSKELIKILLKQLQQFQMNLQDQTESKSREPVECNVDEKISDDHFDDEMVEQNYLKYLISVQEM